jgi:hypothetical protein
MIYKIIIKSLAFELQIIFCAGYYETLFILGFYYFSNTAHTCANRDKCTEPFFFFLQTFPHAKQKKKESPPPPQP